MGIEEARIEVHDLLPYRAKAKMAWLDDARMNGAHRDFEHPFAFDNQMRKLYRRLNLWPLLRRERLA